MAFISYLILRHEMCPVLEFNKIGARPLKREDRGSLCREHFHMFAPILRFRATLSVDPHPTGHV